MRRPRVVASVSVLRGSKGEALVATGREALGPDELAECFFAQIELEVGHAEREVSGHPYPFRLDGLTRGTEVWCVEAKHRTGGITRAQIDLFARPTGAVVDRRWYISNTGFRTEARLRGAELGIRLATASDFTRLKRGVARSFVVDADS